jgi:uncharacterized C2H2 Zn-finger protein
MGSENTCSYCNKIFSDKYSCIRHQPTCKIKKNIEKEEMKELKLKNELLLNEIKYLKEKNEILSNEIKCLKEINEKLINKSTTTTNNNNNNKYNNNSININLIMEKMEPIDFNEIKELNTRNLS